MSMALPILRLSCTDMANTKLSLRVLWTVYKRTAIAQRIGSSKRDLTLAHVAFHSGGRGGVRALDYMAANSHFAQAPEGSPSHRQTNFGRTR